MIDREKDSLASGSHSSAEEELAKSICEIMKVEVSATDSTASKLWKASSKVNEYNRLATSSDSVVIHPEQVSDDKLKQLEEVTSIRSS